MELLDLYLHFQYRPLALVYQLVVSRLLYNDERWGTVCDDGFDQTDADVVCRQLGYRRANSYGNVGHLGYNNVIAWL